MAKQHNGLRFDIYERVHLSEGVTGIKELEGIELSPHIQVLTQGDQAVLRGNLLLSGTYVDEQERPAQMLEHLIPVEITLPLNRVHRMEDISVEIENFDVDLLSSRSLNVTGVLSLNGLEIAPSGREEVWSEAEEEAVFVAEPRRHAEPEPAAQAGWRSEPAAQAGRQPEPAAPREPQSEPAAQAGWRSEPAAQAGRQPEPAAPREPQSEPAAQAGRQPEPAAPREPQSEPAAQAGWPPGPAAPREPQSEPAAQAGWPSGPAAPWGAQSGAESPQPAAEFGAAPAERVESVAAEPAKAPDVEPSEPPQAENAEVLIEAEEPQEAAPSEEKKEMKIAFGSKKTESWEAAEVEQESAASEEKPLGLKSLLQQSSSKQETRPEEDSAPDEDKSLSADSRVEWKKLLLNPKNEQQEFRRLRLCIVQKEETLESIAKRYEMNPREIALFNRLGDGEVSEGQIVYIPK
ncbi:LysM peptidoglycan-binding domain-containing protein [Paenibacillus ginsengihumi]|uniref:LysM peptidoglycan-binding domain-containing protein n=1 Tax=Paenibacillus ginsengihumi TaxID=431596 RepID=UPI000374319A|nr:LysM peptidoglycan-binding domain-containing protein [Paenibacillus ginsengihumi]